MNKIKVKSLFLSDIHLNSPFCKADLLLDILKKYECDNLFLLGDILDFYVKGFNLPNNQLQVIRNILKKAKKGVKVIYVLGNHDDILQQYIELINIEGIDVCVEYIYETNNKKYLLTHGHIADLPIVKELYRLGDLGYSILLTFNHFYNTIRKILGLEYFSISAKIKSGVKQSLSFIEDFEHNLVKISSYKGCTGVIAGHIHSPTIKKINNMDYINCGDWVESCSFIIETKDGEFKLQKHSVTHKQ